MRFQEYVDPEAFAEAVSGGYVRMQTHNELPLTIVNYTEHAQYDNFWNDATIKCRGLVFEQDTYEVVAFCLPKFFNFSQYQNGKYEIPGKFNFSLPTEPFEIFEKVDGSLGTVFWYEDDWHIASRGSFHSDQAKWATSRLRTSDSYRDILNKSLTYVVEIVYPSNRIVVDYGDREDLVLLTVFDSETGQECLSEDLKLEWGWIGSVARRFEPYSLSVQDLADLATENVQIDNDQDKTVEGYESEGYVIRYASGHRVKVKLSDYLRLHKVLTNCTERSIWEVLSAGQSLDVFIDNVPDEFHTWVMQVKNALNSQVDNQVELVTSTYQTIMNKLNWTQDRKVFALVAKEYNFSGSLFALRDGNLDKVVKAAWMSCKPAATKPFMQAES